MKIFISYRRRDSGWLAGRLRDRLINVFGEDAVFRDLEGIPAGADFVDVIDGAIAESTHLLAMIGPEWAAAREDGSRRIDDPTDHVRAEIRAALVRKIPVIPVLLDGVSMPLATKLPSDIALLSRHNAIEVTDARWAYDTQRLIDAIRPPGLLRRIRSRRVVLVAIGALAIAGLARLAFGPTLWTSRMGPLKTDTSYNGHTLDSRGDLNSPDECARACAADEQCRAMTFLSATKLCFLKSSVPSSAHGSGGVSAVKLFQFDPFGSGGEP